MFDLHNHNLSIQQKCVRCLWWHHLEVCEMFLMASFKSVWDVFDGIITQYKYIIKIFVEKKTTGNKHQLLPIHSHRYMWQKWQNDVHKSFVWWQQYCYIINIIQMFIIWTSLLYHDDCNRQRIMVYGIFVGIFIATANNISVMSWRSVLLIEEPGENHRHA
jgi:hypothetical protein